MSYTCPYCGKIVKHKQDHIKRMHPDKAGSKQPAGETPHPGTNEKKVDNSQSQGSPAELKIKKPEPRLTSYHCVDCGTTITKGQTQCPGCGTQLDWSAVNG